MSIEHCQPSLYNGCIREMFTLGKYITVRNREVCCMLQLLRYPSKRGDWQKRYETLQGVRR